MKIIRQLKKSYCNINQIEDDKAINFVKIHAIAANEIIFINMFYNIF
jgi:hypothetical protein